MLDDFQHEQIADPQLQDENNRLKGEQGRPKLPARRPEPANHSSEAERRVPRERVNAAKNPTIPINREENTRSTPSSCPQTPSSRAMRTSSSKTCSFRTDNVRFRKAKWYSPAGTGRVLAMQPFLANARPLDSLDHAALGPEARLTLAEQLAAILERAFACYQDTGTLPDLSSS